jgi:hypothetical protein
VGTLSRSHVFLSLCVSPSHQLGDPNELNDCTATSQWHEDKSSLTLLSLRYDVCPIAYITMVICEFGMIPPTSVPVILREYDITTKAENTRASMGTNLAQSGMFGVAGPVARGTGK